MDQNCTGWQEYDSDYGWRSRSITITISNGSCFTKDSLCLTGANDSSYDGTYNYYTTKSDPPGAVWYNPYNEKYLYPWNYTTSVAWRVGDEYNDSSAHLTCSNAMS